MKKLSLIPALFIALVIALPTPVFAGDIMYVMSARAKLLSSPAFGSKTIENVSKGEKILAVEKKANWYKVIYNDKTGWVSRLSVSSHPPLKRTRRMAGADTKLKDNSRRRASSVSTTAAVRGLTDIDRSRVSNNEQLDYASVELMEKYQVNNSDVVAFMDGIKD
ncbi:MAG: SH3 domain-containing protein [Gammaproteobacteria bacterium]|nr:SH3 domain-containing protein [Gammaproteobacteria bacterium]